MAMKRNTRIGLLLALFLFPGGANCPVLPVAWSAQPDTPNAPQPNDATDPYTQVRGMTISCPRAGQIWGTDETVDSMRELRSLGVNWITIHPYAGIQADGTVGSSRIDRLYRNPTWLTRPIREARELGLKIMIKPHLAYWGSPFAWRQEITFSTEAQWHRFFTTYQRWITKVARLSSHADAFVVGTELGGTAHRQANWRRIITAVRGGFDGPLTYAANWDSFEKVTFWDALDAIGIQSYFPLVDHTALPSQEELDRSWGRLIRRLEVYGVRHGRKVLFTELGYNRSSLAALRPWDYHQGGEHAQEVQRRCLDAALRAITMSDQIAGAFLWKWFPGQVHHEDFLMSTPVTRGVIGQHWSSTTD